MPGIDSYTKLLVHCTVVNGALVFRDDSFYRRPVTPFNNGQLPVMSSAQKKFGGTSLFIPGTGVSGSDGWLTIPASQDFNPGTGPFTIDFWLYHKDQNDEGTVFGFQLDAIMSAYIGAGSPTTRGDVSWAVASGAGGWNIQGFPQPTQANYLTINAWNHIAFVRNGNTFTTYVNGTAIKSFTSALAVNPATGTNALNIGRWGGVHPSHGLNSLTNTHMQEFRYSVGIARWTANFTPPTVPYTSDTAIDFDTKLLLHLNTNLTDSSPSPKTVTPVGSVAISTVKQKFGAGSLRITNSAFSGNHAYFPSTDMNVGANDFTVDFWVNFDAISGYQPLIAPRTTDCTGFGLMAEASGYLYYFASSNGSTWNMLTGDQGGQASGWGTIILTTGWHHIAFTRSNGTFRGFIDGALDFQYTVAGTIFGTSGWVIGMWANGWSDTNAYIDEFRFSNTVARWTERFAPPIAPYAISDPGVDINTELMLHFDAPNNSTAFIDSSKNSYPSSATSPAKISTTASRFGGSSGYFTSTAVATFPTAYPAGNFGAGDFTVDGWINLDNVGANYHVVVMNGLDSSTMVFQVGFNSGNNTFFFAYTTNGSTVLNVNVPYTFIPGQWYHIAVSRTGGKIYFFVNGVLQNAGGTAFTATLYSTTDPLTFGFGGAQSYNGYVDEFRITKGIARWTDSFTPPTGPYYAISSPVDSYTKLMLHMDGTNGLNTFTDSSASAHVMTPYGNAVTSNVQKRFGGTSGRFPGANGGGHYISTPAHTDFDFGTNPWTIDFWSYFTDVTAGGTGRCDFYGADAPDCHFMLLMVLSGKLTTFMSSTGLTWNIVAGAQGTATFVNGVWNHIAVVFNGTTYKFYVNGVLDITVTSSLGLYPPQTVLTIGQTLNNNYNMWGYLDEFRISKGVARWQGNFNPPDRPYYSDSQGIDSYTKLALHMDSNWTDSSSSGIVFTPSGSVNITNAIGVLGAGSGFFPTSSYIGQSSTPNLNVGNGDFTLEARVRFNVVPGGGGYSPVFQYGQEVSPATFSYQMQFENRQLFQLAYSTNGSAVTVVGVPYIFTINTWYHTAICRSGNLLYFFVNGILQNPGGTAFTATIYETTGPLYLGWEGYYTGSAYYMDGYLDEVRVSKGIARWTSDFAVPEVAYATGSLWVNIAKFCGVAQLSIKTALNVVATSIKKIMGVS